MRSHNNLSLTISVKTDTTYDYNNERQYRKRRLPSSPDPYEYNTVSEEEEYEDFDDDSFDEMDEARYCKKPERQLMRPWLIDQVEKGDITGLQWLDGDKTLIKVPWTHASRHGWEPSRDSSLFKSWAIHTGKYKEGDKECNPKRWKANFRCAMNSLPDVEEEKQQSNKKGHNAFKVYRLKEAKKRGCIPSKKPRLSSESDSEQQYRRYATKADRIERHRLLKEIKKKVLSKQSTVQGSEETPITKQRCNTQVSGYYSGCGSDEEMREERKPIIIPKCTEASWHSDVEREEEVRTSVVTSTAISRIATVIPPIYEDNKQYAEHSYARNIAGSNIPSFVEQEIEDATSDYNSNCSMSDGSEQSFDISIAKLVKEIQPEDLSSFMCEPETPTAYTNYTQGDMFKRSDSYDFNYLSHLNPTPIMTTSYSNNNNMTYTNSYGGNSFMQQLHDQKNIDRELAFSSY